MPTCDSVSGFILISRITPAGLIETCMSGAPFPTSTYAISCNATYIVS
jgi:hypothetical protein